MNAGSFEMLPSLINLILLGLGVILAIHFLVIQGIGKTVKYVTCHSMNNKTDYGE